MVAAHTFHFLSTAQGWLVLSAIVIVITGAFALFARGRAGLKWLARQAERRIVRRAPRDTMRVVPSYDLQWFEGTVDGRPAAQLGGRWLMTNPMRDTKTNLVVARIELHLPLWKRLRLDRQSSQMFQAFPEEVPWGATREIHAAFWLVPRRTEPGKDIRAHVVFIDQFENRKRSRRGFARCVARNRWSFRGSSFPPSTTRSRSRSHLSFRLKPPNTRGTTAASADSGA